MAKKCLNCEKSFKTVGQFDLHSKNSVICNKTNCLENEIWKKLENFDNYLFSNFGRVYGSKYEKILKGGNTERYSKLNIYDNEKKKKL